MSNRSQFVWEGRRLLTQQAKPDKPSLLPSSLLAGGVILFLTLTDVATLQSLFNAVFMDKPEMIWILSIATAIILDVSMSVAGFCVSQYAKGMRDKSSTILVTFICLVAFLVALVLCLDLRMNTRDIVFTEIGASQGGLVDLAGAGGGESPDTSAAVLSTARTLSFLPVATSLIAFGISFATSDPRAEKVGKLKAQRRALQNAIARTEAFFAECGDAENELLQRTQQEEELYCAFLAQINDQALQAKQKARILIMQKTGTPDAITRLTEEASMVGNKPLSEIRATQFTQPPNDHYAA